MNPIVKDKAVDHNAHELQGAELVLAPEDLIRGHSPIESMLNRCQQCLFGSYHYQSAELDQDGSVVAVLEEDSHGISPSPTQISDENQASDSGPILNHYSLPFIAGVSLENQYFDFPVVDNSAVQMWIRYFTKRKAGVEGFQRYAHLSGRYSPLMSEILYQQGLPRDLIYLAMAESGFQNHAKSWAKAVGPWQFMPKTGKRYGLKIDWYRDERRDPIKATYAAAAYLKDLYGMFGSWELAAAGYNAGEGRVSRAIRRTRTKNFWKIRSTGYLRRETKNYVPKIIALAIVGKNLNVFGFEQIDFDEPIAFETLEVQPLTDLFHVAEAFAMDVNELRRWNPELIRWQTPPGENYFLRLPIGTLQEFEGQQLQPILAAFHSANREMSGEEVKSMNHEESTAEYAYQEYVIKSASTTYAAVANKFKVPLHVIADINRSSIKERLKRGDVVYLPFRKGQSHKDPMYSDLYEKPARWIRRRASFNQALQRAMKKGKEIQNPSQFYTVQKGDSLWSVARKFKIPLDNLIKTNYSKVKKGFIKTGDVLAVK